MRFGIVVFPGSNCEFDVHYALTERLGQEAVYLWHADADLAGAEAVVLPGGFSYGDYLRAGAIARFAPAMGAVADLVRRGGLVLGICNGFQILCEAGLLPGMLYRNQSRQFRCQDTRLRVERADTPFTLQARPGDIWKIPINHGEGNYYADAELLAQLETRRQVVLRYVDAAGRATPEANPNGALGNIAGIVDETGRVMGLMPHPERASDALLGSEDGLVLFRSMMAWLAERSLDAREVVR